jgi:hypothetical protein
MIPYRNGYVIFRIVYFRLLILEIKLIINLMKIHTYFCLILDLRLVLTRVMMAFRNGDVINLPNSFFQNINFKIQLIINLLETLYLLQFDP